MQPPLFYLIDTSTTEIYTLSLHDALPISAGDRPAHRLAPDTVLTRAGPRPRGRRPARADRRRPAPPRSTPARSTASAPSGSRWSAAGTGAAWSRARRPRRRPGPTTAAVPR